MGLYDDAVSEFRIAAIDPQRRIDCLTLEGICLRDRGDFPVAEELFQSTLALEGLTEEEQLSINYELAFLYETMGRKDESVHIYRRVLSISPGFRDAAKKIACLQGIEEGEETELLELDAEDLDP
jgi:tetratricopeptide (TPR) repeat protein